MPTFDDLDELDQSLAEGDVPLDAAEVRATVRPVLMFARQQLADDPLPVGTSKIGGFPDLPAGVPWPERPAYADAVGRAAQFRRGAARTRALFEQMMRQPLLPHQQPTTPADLDRITAEGEARCTPLFVPMPLAFVAQLDLATLSQEAGFDPELPSTGLLSIFNDATCEGVTGMHWVFWYDRPVRDLVRTAPPERLVAYSDAVMNGGTGPFGDKTMAERLHPFSALSVPRHWKSLYAFGTQEADAVYDWLDCQPGFNPTASDMGLAGQVGNFGDRLGGWPEDLQGHPEDEIAVEGISAKPIREPGQTPWRHLFSYGGEHWGDTRLMPSPSDGDGNTYVFLHEDDLRARRFERAQAVYQST